MGRISVPTRGYGGLSRGANVKSGIEGVGQGLVAAREGTFDDNDVRGIA
jgi:hypothetical protein